ncbi:flagellar export chaperone FlgN [uncultured Arthrobacter sp.]|uniref:flagellar export chaperone FlgN n=1 Tax=uncultured Arthrobacter sp. TaxID=114050 RepID=UPI003216C840
MGAGDLSAALWQERRQLELLLFRLETQRLHVLAGNLRWLSFTAAEVESVLDRLRFEALARSVESAAVAAEWGLPAQATLNELVAGAPPGAWAEVLQDHLDGLRELLRQLNDAARTGEESLRNLNRPVESGTPAGLRSGDATAALPADTAGVLDQLTTAGNIERALAVVRRTNQPLLEQYLGGSRD